MNSKTIPSILHVDEIDYEQFVTEDDTPVDNMFSDQQQRLLVEPLYTSWNYPQPFLARANIGLYYDPDRPPLVPDMLLSLGTKPAKDRRAKKNRVFFTWVFGKAPDVVVEVVSNREGGEADQKFRIYEEIGVPYYVIFDPDREILTTDLLIYELLDCKYIWKQNHWLEKVGLGLVLWEGVYEQEYDLWLRWCDQKGKPIPIAAEQRLRAEQERIRAEQERIHAKQEREIKERLAARLRAMGIDPDE
ncbi:MAG: Uma2 family endonuclease [Candidatus Omnitrophota bacterium]|jgi:Uma2 family endonuclease|nr:MAG: Uma2 family endonuclease [Candidatus Omnitrophota bacterium]